MKRAVGLRRLTLPTLAIPPGGLCGVLPDPKASFPAGLEAKVGRNLIPSAILASSGSSSSPAKRAREVLGENAELDEPSWAAGFRLGVWKDEEGVEEVHQSDDDIVAGGAMRRLRQWAGGRSK